MTPGTTVGSGQCYQSYHCVTSALYHNHQNNQEEKQANACWGINSAVTHSSITHFSSLQLHLLLFLCLGQVGSWLVPHLPGRGGEQPCALGRAVLRLWDALTQ